jgi:hypothetical protein
VTVWRAIAAVFAAIKFWIVNLPTLVRLTWFPLAVLGFTSYMWLHWTSLIDIAYVEARNGNGSPPSFDAAPPDDVTIVWLTLQLIALSAAAAAVHRFVVLGERRAGEFFAFSFGKPERAYFLMGLIAYVLMVTLIAGQYAAQLTWPDLGSHMLDSVAKPYANLGPWSLMMFAFPGELPIFEMPPLNYALWSALVIALLAFLVRFAPWPAIAASESNLAIGDTLALTRGRSLTTVTFAAATAALLLLGLAILTLAGLSALAASGPDALGQMLKGLAANPGPQHPDIEIRSIINARDLAFYQEIARFIAGIVGITLGATLISHLYIALRNEPAT